MDKDVINSELQIPEYVGLNTILNCKECKNYNECYFDNTSKYNCKKFLYKLAYVKLGIEAFILAAVTVSSLIHFNGFWITLLKIVATFLSLGFLDFGSDMLIKYIFAKSEKIRREKYALKVQQIEEENEAIRKANLGITEEMEEFLNNSVNLFNELSCIFYSFSSKLNKEINNEKRVYDKFSEVLKELEELNGILSENNADTTYITTFYEIHLPKLLDYSKRFSDSFNSNILTQDQIIEFSNLLEVFRVKIINYITSLKTKESDDFIIKMRALNEDVIPEYDGSEVESNE